MSARPIRQRMLRRTCLRCGACIFAASMLCMCGLAQAGLPQEPAAPATAATAAAAAANSLAVLGTPAAYVLHPGDGIAVSYRFTPEFDDTATVAPDGRVTLKNIGVVPAAGGTVQQLQDRIAQAASSQLVNPQITVTLKDFQRPQIVVGGEVQLPLHFELRKPTTVLEAILLAGGPKQDSAMSHVLLFRRVSDDTAETHVLNLSHLRSGAHAADDIALQPGDMILVRHDRLSVVERYTKIVNLGVYFNPLGNNGVL